MISRRLWSTTSRRLTILLLAVVLPPAATLIWLGSQLLEQDVSKASVRSESVFGRPAQGRDGPGAADPAEALGRQPLHFSGGIRSAENSGEPLDGLRIADLLERPAGGHGHVLARPGAV